MHAPAVFIELVDRLFLRVNATRPMLLMRNQRFVEDCQTQKNQQARPDHAPGQDERCYAEIKE
ncbi:hypothetical protein SDC9_87066 [bioreactor metagenome]|uniref:Uncharacterized protein n=1 Tax=bioreactor metagenome TaxID=1076179 RepID=A0A644ZHP8_9ZZZZ